MLCWGLGASGEPDYSHLEYLQQGTTIFYLRVSCVRVLRRRQLAPGPAHSCSCLCKRAAHCQICVDGEIKYVCLKYIKVLLRTNLPTHTHTSIPSMKHFIYRGPTARESRQNHYLPASIYGSIKTPWTSQSDIYAIGRAGSYQRRVWGGHRQPDEVGRDG